MSTETELFLTDSQWDVLRALRPRDVPPARVNRYVLDQLAAMGLVAACDTAPTLTPAGRATVLRGCPRLWDLAA